MGILSDNTETSAQVEISPAAEVETGTQDMDELLAELSRETIMRSEDDEKEEKKLHYDDFEPEPEQEPAPSEPETKESKKDPIADLDEPSDVEKAMSDLSALPAETLVDTVDTIATEFIVSRFRISEYEGHEANSIITTAKQKKDLTKATERYLASQKIKISPLAVLIVTVVLIYGRKIMLASQIKNIMKRNRELENDNLRKDGAMDVLQQERDAARAEAIRQKEAREAAEAKLAKAATKAASKTVPKPTSTTRRKPATKNEGK